MSGRPEWLRSHSSKKRRPTDRRQRRAATQFKRELGIQLAANHNGRSAA